MKPLTKPLLTGLLASLLAAPLFAQAQVGVSINVGEPGFYGQINIGNAAPPPVVYQAPMVVEAPPGGVIEAPLYLRVPEEHHRNWRKFCHQYNACNRKVYFVTEDWYGRTYANHRHEEHEVHEREEHEHDHDHDRDHDHHEHGYDEDRH